MNSHASISISMSKHWLSAHITSAGRTPLDIKDPRSFDTIQQLESTLFRINVKERNATQPTRLTLITLFQRVSCSRKNVVIRLVGAELHRVCVAV
uniref:Uncharacterized protein MANES_06G106600 n=1 Tax=Rhizophora mucronata TaxID=61149 RepID=A0A2P2IWF9_RHIMU